MTMPVWSRRELLRAMAIAGAAVGTAGLLQACGGTATPAAPPSSASAAASAAGKPSAAAAAGSSASALAKPGGLSFSIAHGNPAAVNTPLWVADALHAYTDNGVNVKVTIIDNAAAIPALLAKEVDSLFYPAGSVITGNAAGTDLVMIASVQNHAVNALYAAPSIKTAADLKGKVVASDRPGTPTDYNVQVQLSLLGLKPTDVQLLPVGASGDLPALLSGQAQAAGLSVPDAFQAEAKGFQVLQDLHQAPYQGPAIVITRSRIEQLAPAIPGFLRALRAGMQAYDDQPEQTMKIMAERTKQSDPAILQKTYDFYKTKAPFEKTLKPTIEGIQGQIDFLGQTLPAVKGTTPEQYIDTRFLAQLS